MSTLSLQPPAIADDATLQAMEDAALGILERTGMAVHDRALREKLADLPGLKLDGERVLVRAEAAQVWLSAYRRARPPEVERPFLDNHSSR